MCGGVAGRTDLQTRRPARRERIGHGPDARQAADVCHQLGLGTEAKDTEGVRAKLKRLVKRSVLSEPEAGLFTLAGAGRTDQTARDQQP